MKLRYRKSNDFYIPQYQSTDDSEWNDFLVKNITDQLAQICQAIGDLQCPRRWEPGQWHSEDKGKNRGDQTVFFTKEMYVMAFLGAAKSVYNTQTVEFKL